MTNEVICEVCGKKYKKIIVSHLRLHGFNSTREYLKAYPNAKLFSDTVSEQRKQIAKIEINNPLQTVSSTVNQTIPSHRTKKRIDYNEFLELLSQGLSLKDIKKQGISKHQVGFYSALAQSKISITKDQFEHEYHSGKKLDEIAKQYSIPKDHMASLREHFGIKRLGAKFINRKKTEIPITIRQKKIIYGGLLGDAGKMSPSAIFMKQSLKQKEYLMWKHEELKEHVSPKSLQENSCFDKRYNKTYYTMRFYTYANTDIENIIREFYGPDGKWVSDDVLYNLDELSLAVWFMDDGTTDWYYRSKKHIKQSNRRPTCKLCTDSFTFSDCSRIITWFDEVWDIQAQTCSVWGRPEHTRILFNVDDTAKLFSLIKPHIIPCMRYKVDYDTYLKHREQLIGGKNDN